MKILTLKTRNVRDSVLTSNKLGENYVSYIHADVDCPPHFPVPALPVQVTQGRFWVIIKNRWTLRVYAAFHRGNPLWNYYFGSGQ